MSVEEMNIDIREGTTRYINITCKSKETGRAFDFTGYTVQTWLGFDGRRQYVETVIVENMVSYKIPAEISLGVREGVAETRIFKDGDVYEILRINVAVHKAKKPDIAPNN